MSRGRKPASFSIGSDWEEIFNRSVGHYLQIIIIELGREIGKTNSGQSGEDLLNKIRGIKKKPFSKIEESESPFKIPPHWIWCRIGEVIEFATNLNIETKFSPDTLINYVDIDSIDNKRYKIREVKPNPVSELSSRARRVLKKGHIVYSLVRPYLNNIAIVEEDLENLIGSTGFAVFRGIFVNNRYLKLLLLSPYIRDRYLEMLSGFNSPSISQEQFVLTPLPLPPVSEQDAIVRFLEDLETNSIKENEVYFNREVERKIVAQHKLQLTSSNISTELTHQLSLVQKLRQQLLQEAVQGKLVPQDPSDEPAGILLQKIKAEKERLMKEKKIKKDKNLPEIKAEEIPFEIPEGWVWCRFNDSAIIESNLVSPFKFPNLPHVAPDNIEKNSGKLLTTKTVLEDKVQSANHHFYAGQLIYSKVRPKLNKVAKVDFEGLCSADMYPLRPLINIGFLQYCMLSEYFLTQVDKFDNRVKMPKINQNQLSQIPIPLPPLAEQHRIVQKLEQLLQVCDALQASIQESRGYNEQLLQQVLREALKGE